MVRPEPSPSEQRETQGLPAEDAVRAQLERILGSPDFAQADRMKTFLRFIVEEALAGRQDRLKEFAIATEVFDRDETFDPQTNTIVRVEAGRLRRRLERYYLTDGRGDSLRIDVPKGSYAPLFRASEAVEPTSAPEKPAVPATPAGPAGPATAPTTEAVLSVPTGPSIAVLPFDNLSGDPGEDFFADGVTEEIISDLTRFPDLRVISRRSTFKYKGQQVDVRDVGRDLEVRYVLEGSVRKAGDMVRVTSQLIDATDGTHLFSETYDSDLSTRNILEIQDDIADRIVAAVGQPYGVIARTGARMAGGTAAEHLDSYGAVLRFYEYWVRGDVALYEPVRAGLERAVERDPDYASAWAALASLYLDEVRFGFNPRSANDQLDRALEAAQRAVMIEPENSMAYHFLFSAHFHRGELDEFRANGERAVSLNPNHADMLADYGIMLCCIGEWDRGMALTEKAMALSPTHPGWFHIAALVNHYRKGDYAAAYAEAKQVNMPEFFWTYVFFAMCCGQLGLDREGRAACDKLLELVPDISEAVWDRMAAWNFPRELADHVVDGLRKAGLPVADGPA